MPASLRPVLPPFLVALTLLFAFTGLFTTAYQDPAPHEIPIGVVAPPAGARALQAGLDHRLPGGFDVRSSPGAASGAFSSSPCMR